MINSKMFFYLTSILLILSSCDAEVGSKHFGGAENINSKYTHSHDFRSAKILMLAKENLKKLESDNTLSLTENANLTEETINMLSAIPNRLMKEYDNEFDTNLLEKMVKKLMK